MSDRPLVYLLDDEPTVLRALTRLLDAHGFRVQSFADASALFAGIDPDTPACLVLDLAMPEQDGLAVQQRLLREAGWLGIVFLTGHGDLPQGVRAIKAGAEDFLSKPINAAQLIPAIRAALARSTEHHAQLAEQTAARARLALLTPREREVLGHVIAGHPNKRIAATLGTGEQTIKVHRGRVMAKLGVDSVAALVRFAQRLGVAPED
jgi:FixJ family two-component response regulator